jgi:hypothetical protein
MGGNMSMTVTNEVPVVEVNGKDVPFQEPKVLVIRNHWNIDRAVVIEWEGTSITVWRNQLEAAMQNATNWR